MKMNESRNFSSPPPLHPWEEDKPCEEDKPWGEAKPWGEDKPWCHHPVLDWSQFAGTHQDKVGTEIRPGYSSSLSGILYYCLTGFCVRKEETSWG